MNPPSLSASNQPLPQKCGLALASLILGITSIVLCLGPLTGIPAVICGHMAQARIRRSAGAMSGGGMAIAGLVLGYVSFVFIVFVVGLLSAVAIPNFVRARDQAQRAGCVANLHMIEGAKATWALEQKKRATDIPEEADLIGPGKYIREKPVCPAGGSYSLSAAGEKAACSIPGHQL